MDITSVLEVLQIATARYQRPTRRQSRTLRYGHNALLYTWHCLSWPRVFRHSARTDILIQVANFTLTFVVLQITYLHEGGIILDEETTLTSHLCSCFLFVITVLASNKWFNSVV